MYLAMRELLHSKLKFLMIASIIVLISWLVFILSGLGNGLSSLAAATFKNMKADYVVFEQGARASMSRSFISDELLAEAEKLPGVQAASPMGGTMATALKARDASDEDKVDIAILGIIPGSFLEPAVIEGEGLAGEEPNGVIVNDSLKNKGYQLGDTILLSGSVETLTIVGFVKNETYNHLPTVFTTLDTWRTISFAALGSDRGLNGPVNAIMLQGKEIDPEMVDSKLAGTETVSKATAVRGLPGYKEENGTIMMMLLFLMAISAFVLGAFFYVLTMQKSNQFGVMKAIGATNAFLGKVIVSQVFLLTLVSIATGILLTYATAAAIPEGMPFKLEINLVLGYSVILLLIAVFSSLISVRQITKIDPLKAIGRTEA